MNSVWTEKYRPSTFAEVIGQDLILERVSALTKQKNIPNLLFAGPSGVGKTSLILAAAKELYGDNWKENVMSTNASDERGIDHVRYAVKDFSRTKPIGNAQFKLCILDEADALTKEAQQALRRTMEIYSDNVRFCLIANFSSKIIEPIQSRCTVFRFKSLDENAMAKIIEVITQKEKLIMDKKAIEAIVNIADGDVRKAINVLQTSASLNKKITDELVYNIENAVKPREIKELLMLSLQGEFTKSRDKLLDSMLKHGLSGLDVLKQIQKEILNLEISDKDKAKLIELCGEIEFRLVEGSDEYIQLEALLASFCLIGK
ncbi:MAG: replication factor C small subunit [Nanoarchaeota archaeon]